MPSNDAHALAPEEVLEITRVLEAPRTLVFKLWESPEHIARWWGPETCWLETIEMDFRVGGAWRFLMRNGHGLDHRISGEYREIRPPERLSFTYVNAYDQHEMLVTIDFLERGEKTEMRFRQAPFLNVSERDGHKEGWSSTLDLLVAYLLRIDHATAMPWGRPRRDGVAEDIAAARTRQHSRWSEQSEEADKLEDGR